MYEGDPFYWDISCCDQTRRVDDMFSRFETEKNLVLGILMATPDRLPFLLWSEASPLSIDRRCMWKMGLISSDVPPPPRPKTFFDFLWTSPKIPDSKSLPRGLRRSFSCPQCRNMERLVDFRKYPVGTPFLIESGQEAGERLIITDMPATHLSLKFEQESNSFPIAGTRSMPTFPYQTLQSDEFTNNILISFLLEYILREDITMPSCCSLLTAFVCGDTGYLLSKAPTYASLEQLASIARYLDDENVFREDVTRGILQQLFAILNLLSGYDFIHGSASEPTSLSFKNEPCSYMIDGVHVTCPVTVQLSNFSRSSITIDTAMAPAGTTGKLRLIPSSFLPELHDNKVMPKASRTLTPRQLKICRHLQQIGIPLDIPLDAYDFLLSMMRIPAFSQSVLKYYRPLWDELEIPSEVIDVHHDDLMTTFPLRTDIVAFTWEFLRSPQTLESLRHLE